MNLIHPIIICFIPLNNISEGDRYLYDSATSPDCHIRTERSPAVETVESGADEANRTVRIYPSAILLGTTSVNQLVNLRSHNNAYFK